MPPFARMGNIREMMKKTSLTGIKPTGTPHLGNYLGAIRPALALAGDYESLYFIADYHAFTSVHEPAKLRSHTYDVAATWLACGLDPEKTTFYRQSDVIEVFELMWIFDCLIATGQLERGHAYKDALAKGDAPNAGIFNYPVLMAADIVLYDCHLVPVGKDQKQHLEVARDLAERLNHLFGEGTVVVPEPLINEEVQVLGTDGRKMSKSYGNTIPLFAPAKELRSTVMKIVTGSESLEAPKEAEGTTIFNLHRAVVSPEKAAEMKQKLAAGGYGWGHAKQELFEALEAELGPKREVYTALRADEAKLDALLQEGAEKARVRARRVIDRVRKAIGVSR